MRERDGKPLEEVLSAAEQRVFRELLAGATDEEVAERLGIGIATVRYHIRNSVRRMEVADRDALMAVGSPPEAAADADADRESAADAQAGADAESASSSGRGRKEGSGLPRVLLVGVAVVGLLGAAFAGGVVGGWFTNDDGPPPPPATGEDTTGERDGSPESEAAATSVSASPTPPPATATPAATPPPTTEPTAAATPTPAARAAATATPVPATPTATVRVAGSVPDWEHPNLTFWGDVPEAGEAFLRARIADMVAFFDERFGIRVPNLDIHIAARMPALEEALKTTLGYETAISTGQYVGGSIFVHWTAGRRGIERLYLEAFQDHVAGSREKGPWWLTEGVASYATYRYRDARGQEAFGDIYASDIRRANLVPEPLRDLEQAPWAPGVFQERYTALALVAVDWLLRVAGEDALATYYGALRTNWWERAFEQSFGLSLEDVYRDFATYREAAVGVRRAITGRVLGVDGEPIRDWPVFVHAVYADGSGSHSSSVPRSGEYSVRAPDGAYRIAVATICPSGSGRLGWYEEESGFTPGEQEATLVTLRGEDISGIVIRLPAMPDDGSGPCGLRSLRTLSGVVRHPDGTPLPGLKVTAFNFYERDEPDSTVVAEDGRFALKVPDATYQLNVYEPCGRWLGAYNVANGSFFPLPIDDSRDTPEVHLLVDREGVTDLEIVIPSGPLWALNGRTLAEWMPENAEQCQ